MWKNYEMKTCSLEYINSWIQEFAHFNVENVGLAGEVGNLLMVYSAYQGEI